MTLPYSTPGVCCDHNLNFHSGEGRGRQKKPCLACGCEEFIPAVHSERIIGMQPRCEARHIRGDWTEMARCFLSPHVVGNHKAMHPHQLGVTIVFNEETAIYPKTADDAITELKVKELKDVQAEVLKEKGARHGQVGGDHYRTHKIQPWDIWEAYGLNAFEGAIIKYVLRHRDKGGVQDLKKARHTLDKLIELEEGK